MFCLSEPRGDEEKGAAAWLMDRLAAELFLNSCISDSVFVTLFRTAVERAISGVHKLLGTGGVPASLTLLFWRWLSLFGLYWSERRDKLLIGTPPPPSPVPNKPYVASVVSKPVRPSGKALGW